jgi:hypothetical protein
VTLSYPLETTRFIPALLKILVMSTAETIYERVRNLPAGQAKAVLFILTSTLSVFELIHITSRWFRREEHASVILEQRRLLSQVAKGRFAHLPNSSDAFAQRKQAEIDWENRHR